MSLKIYEMVSKIEKLSPILNKYRNYEHKLFDWICDIQKLERNNPKGDFGEEIKIKTKQYFRLFPFPSTLEDLSRL